MEQTDIKHITDAIEAEMEYQSFQNMGVDVDESAYEPNITIFTSWYDEFTKKQAELINEKFNVFKTTEYLNGAEVYTEEDVNTSIDIDGIENSEGSVRFVAVIDADTKITDEFVNELAVAYVQQMTNFWDEVYSEELLKDRFEENINEKLLKDAKDKFKIKKLNEELKKVLNEKTIDEVKYICLWSLTSYDVTSKDWIKVVDFDFFTDEKGYNEEERKELLNLEIGESWVAPEPFIGHIVIKVPVDFCP